MARMLTLTSVPVREHLVEAVQLDFVGLDTDHPFAGGEINLLVLSDEVNDG